MSHRAWRSNKLWSPGRRFAAGVAMIGAIVMAHLAYEIGVHKWEGLAAFAFAYIICCICVERLSPEVDVCE